MENVDTILWDWNGTLLNDTDICIETINILLRNRQLPQLSKEQYHQVFGFPVIDYYRKIGFDFDHEPFEIPARQYIDIYSEKVKKCPLHLAATEVLSFFRSKKYNQFVLSASEIGLLQESINHFQINHFFEALAGLDNHYAVSKTEIGKALLNKRNIDPQRACLIGDTLHDYEVALEIGCQCLLVADGHQPKKKLLKTGAPVLEALEEVMTFFD